jgi:hypothetical protein
MKSKIRGRNQVKSHCHNRISTLGEGTKALKFIKTQILRFKLIANLLKKINLITNSEKNITNLKK